MEYLNHQKIDFSIVFIIKIMRSLIREIVILKEIKLFKTSLAFYLYIFFA